MSEARLENGLVRVECGVEVRLTPQGRRMEAWEDFHRAVVYAVHTHNMTADRHRGDFIALGLPKHNLDADGHDMVGEVITLFGSKEALTSFLEDTPQFDKLVRRRVAMHGEVVSAEELRSGTAFIRDRSKDRLKHLMKIDPDRARDLSRKRERCIVMNLNKFQMHILPASGQPVEAGRVSTYGLSSKKDPLFL
jgi:hypothetical protein